VLSRKADYALRAMVELASAPNETISTKELAHKIQVPYTFMTKIITELSVHKFVKITRGNKGGAKISCDLKKTTALQIVEAISGPLLLNRCIDQPKICSRTNFCSLHEILIKAQNDLANALSVNLRSLARSQQNKIKLVKSN
jgi:Rrf2 family protein